MISRSGREEEEEESIRAWERAVGEVLGVFLEIIS